MLARGDGRAVQERRWTRSTVIKWKEIYDLIESATDSCLAVANIIEGVVLEHA